METCRPGPPAHPAVRAGIGACTQVELAEFWSAALGYTVLVDSGDYTMIAPPASVSERGATSRSSPD